MAGAPCPMVSTFFLFFFIVLLQELCKNVVDEMNMRDFNICYGMTETSPVTFQGFCSDPMEVSSLFQFSV